MEIKAVNFAYDTTAMSATAFDRHMELYRGYVAKVNSITDALKSGGPAAAGAPADAEMYRGLKSGETYALNGVILHEEYFRNMTAERVLPGERASAMLISAFGSYDAFADAFKKCANGARGWCVLAYEQRTKEPRILMQDSHDSGVVTTAFPLLIIDVYEHAYYTDYGTEKPKYIEAFMASIDWRVVERRVERAGLG